MSETDRVLAKTRADGRRGAYAGAAAYSDALPPNLRVHPKGALSLLMDLSQIAHERGETGLGLEHALALTLPVTGAVAGTVSISARLVRSGVCCGIEKIRDLVLGGKTDTRAYPIFFTIPKSHVPAGLGRFGRLA
ncbi:MAG: hypothetical protein ACE5I1_29185 [bacterium]